MGNQEMRFFCEISTKPTKFTRALVLRHEPGILSTKYFISEHTRRSTPTRTRCLSFHIHFKVSCLGTKQILLHNCFPIKYSVLTATVIDILGTSWWKISLRRNIPSVSSDPLTFSGLVATKYMRLLARSLTDFVAGVGVRRRVHICGKRRLIKIEVRFQLYTSINCRIILKRLREVAPALIHRIYLSILNISSMNADYLL
jgi:hypothetical protein